MECERSPARNRFLSILRCIVTVMWPIIFVGCQGVTEPPGASGANPSLSDAQTGTGVRVAVGPILTLTNEYMDPVVSPTAGAFMKIPEGVPLTFCWSAEEAPGGGSIETYRYGWDVADPNDPENWDVEVTPYDGSKVCAPARTFSAGTHFFTVEVEDDAGASWRINIVIQIVFGPPSFDIMPRTCKNPLNTRRKGRIRTAIPGRIGLDVSEIDVESLYLWVDGNIVEPVGTRIRDVTSPLINGSWCECPPEGTDGIDDLMILFAAKDIIRAMGPVSRGESRALSIRGALHDGHTFSLTDCVEIVGNPPGGGDPALFQKDAVLVALEKGYNAKNYEKVSSLLDTDFTFFFSDADVQSGNVAFTQWDRDHELAATAKLFNVDNTSIAPAGKPTKDKPLRVQAMEEAATWGKVKAAFHDGIVGGETFIALQMGFPEGEDNWIAVNPPDPVQYPNEVWYEKTAGYFLLVQTGEITFVTGELLLVSFVVRFSEEKGYWQLVEWRDDM